MISPSTIARMNAAMAPCRVSVSVFDYNFSLAVGWRHPSGGSSAMAFPMRGPIHRAAEEAAQQALAIMEADGPLLVAQARWPLIETTRWQRWTMWFRPRLSLRVRVRKAARESAEQSARAIIAARGAKVTRPRVEL